MTIGIVTDSTAYLSKSAVESYGIEVIPVQVIVDGVAHSDAQEISIDELVLALRANKSVTTSRPSVQSFIDSFEKLHAAGNSEIISIHLSSKLSGTYASAVLASQKVNFPVTVIDSSGVAGFLELAVLRAVQLRDQGNTVDQIAAEVITQCANTKMYFYVDTLEFLQRGGRISIVKSKVGQLLSVKPILKMQDGRVELLELARTETKALNKLIELATTDGVKHQFRINHVAAEDRANQLAEAIADQLKIDPIPVSQAGAVVGAHVGPGTVALVIH